MKEKMDEENPLHYVPHINNSKCNKSGRPTNENLIIFSPQPRSRISEMLRKIKQGNENPMKTDNTKIRNDDTEENDFGDNVYLDSTKEHLRDVDVKTKLIIDSKNNKTTLHSCDFPKCSYTTKLSSNLIKHKRTHTKEKPYLCDQCSFRSNFVNSLKAHKRIHTNERPYSCKFCSYRCNSSSNLKKHCKHRHWNMT